MCYEFVLPTMRDQTQFNHFRTTCIKDGTGTNFDFFKLSQYFQMTSSKFYATVWLTAYYPNPPAHSCGTKPNLISFGHPVSMKGGTATDVNRRLDGHLAWESKVINLIIARDRCWRLFTSPHHKSPPHCPPDYVGTRPVGMDPYTKIENAKVASRYILLRKYKRWKKKKGHNGYHGAIMNRVPIERAPHRSLYDLRPLTASTWTCNELELVLWSQSRACVIV